MRLPRCAGISRSSKKGTLLSLGLHLVGPFALAMVCAVACAAGPEPVAVLELSQAERDALAAAKTWKIVVVEKYPRKGNSLRVAQDCEYLLKHAGWRVIAKQSDHADVLLSIEVKGNAKSAVYTDGVNLPLDGGLKLFNGAELEMTAFVKIERNGIVRFHDSRGEVECPRSIPDPRALELFLEGPFRNGPRVKVAESDAADAPFGRAYEECSIPFFSQLFCLIYACRGMGYMAGALDELLANERIITNVQKGACLFVRSNREFVQIALNSSNRRVRQAALHAVERQVLNGVLMADRAFDSSVLQALRERLAIEADEDVRKRLSDLSHRLEQLSRPGEISESFLDRSSP